MIALVFGEQETSILVSTKHTDYQFVAKYLPHLKAALLSPDDLWDDALGSVLLASLLFPLPFVQGTGLGQCSHHSRRWFGLCSQKHSWSSSSLLAARLPEFLAVAMELCV